jgi:copper chaperone CopZ
MHHLLAPLIRFLLTVGILFSVQPVLPGWGAEQIVQRRVVIGIKGMMCASCGQEIEKILTRVTGVVTVKVDLSYDRATVTYDEHKVTPHHLAEVIRKAGYEAMLPGEAHPLPPSGR